MWCRHALVTLVLVFGAVPAAGTQSFPDDARLQAAFVAWDRGDYPAALAGYLAVLNGPEGARHRDTIARLTGEPFVVDEITAAGRSSARIGPDGRFVSYVAEQDGRILSHVADSAAGWRVVATVEATVTALVTDGLAYVPAGAREVRLRTLPDGPERTIDLEGWLPAASFQGSPFVVSPEGEALYVLAGRTPDGPATGVLRYRDGTLTVLETGDGRTSNLLVAAGGRHVVFDAAPLPGGGRGGAGAVGELVILDMASGEARRFAGKAQATVSRDGSTIAFIGRDETAYQVEVLTLGAAASVMPTVVVRAAMPLQSPALSPSGSRVAYQGRPLHDWEIYAASTVENGRVVQLTAEIQHDILPAFIDERTVLALKGEPRHRRSYLYDIETRDQTKLFHNNTVRTVSQEYEWQVSRDGTKVVIVADRDGDTISRERGVYIVHVGRGVPIDVLRERLERNLEAEDDLRARGERAFAPVAEAVRSVTTRIEPERIYQYARALYAMGSKHITQPGNAQAIAYLERTLRGWGYDVDVQWFDTPGVGATTLRTANVVARLPGTLNPELVYVAGSHFDSVTGSPGADDNSSGTTALLEVARVLRERPQPATIELVWFTAEESGLRGSTEYARRAVESGTRVVGGLNNDMVGWTRHHRLDNTIRYSNAGIRDIQHAAAIQFSDLITYDSHYYQGTDAAALYQAFGDVLGGIGSYPILESPHYHQTTDRIENVNMRLVAEVGRTTAATLMLLASSPSRLAGVQVEVAGAGAVEVSWTAAPERGVAAYLVRSVAADGRTMERTVPADGGTRPSVRLSGLAAGSALAVKAVNDRGLAGWDWARASAP